jgi:hypothetical protein
MDCIASLCALNWRFELGDVAFEPRSLSYFSLGFRLESGRERIHELGVRFEISLDAFMRIGIGCARFWATQM